MNNYLSILFRHEDLHHRFSKAQPENLQEDSSFIEKVLGLLKDIVEAAGKVTMIDDYLWLRNTYESWRVAGGSMGLSLEYVFPASPKDLRPSPNEEMAWSEEGLTTWIESRAYELHKERALRHHSRMPIEEIVREYSNSLPPDVQSRNSQEDWRLAEVALAEKILDGQMNIFRQLSSDSYARLERVWLDDVKRLKAYFFWRERGNGWGIEASKKDYDDACGKIRSRLREEKPPVPRSAFNAARGYLEEHYWDRVEDELRIGVKHDGIDLKKLIEVKEKRLKDWAVEHSVQTDGMSAREYVETYYGNVLQAVLNDDEESTRKVLGVLGFGPDCRPNESIVNCFEMGIAIYFLNSSTVCKLVPETT